MTLTTHHLTFHASAMTALALDEQAGSQMRGAIVGALWGRFCANKAAPRCADCPLSAVVNGLPLCPVAQLVAPMREAGEAGGEQRPRPYVTRPPVGGRYAPGESFCFGLALFGAAAQLFPYVIMAAQLIEEAGLGRPLAEERGRRGRIVIERIDAVHPLTGVEQTLYRRGGGQVKVPGLPVTGADVQAYAAGLPMDRLMLRFVTPLRLIEDGRLVKQLRVRVLMQRLIWRLDELTRAYGDAPGVDRRGLVALADGVEVVEDGLRWVDVVSYSTRTHQRAPIGGLVGTAVLAGELGPLRELLVWGMLVHVGKNAVKGDGWYWLSG